MVAFASSSAVREMMSKSTIRRPVLLDVLAAVENLVGDGWKAKGGSALRYSGVEVGGLDIPEARRIGGCRAKVGVTEAKGITASSVEVLEKAGVSLAKEVMSEFKASRRWEARTAC